MLKDYTSFNRVILAAGKTDLRRGMDGLKAIVQLKYGLDPLEPGTLFLFCGTRRDRIKGLVFDKDAFLRLMEGFTVESSIRIPVVQDTHRQT